MRAKLLFLFALSFSIGCSFSQIPVANSHIANNYINKFEGTWIWSSGSDTVIVQLKKMTIYFNKPTNSSADELFGCHKYVNGNAVIENSLNKYDSLINQSRIDLSTIHALNTSEMDTSLAKGSIRDITKSKRNDCSLEFLSGAPIRIRMRIENREGIKVSLPGKPYIPGITLPVDIVLIKQ